ncbi:hypothetical protein SUNI508_06668 [Seiridium unicorne]|uniref:Uncharacterized protein n=1 Tax=Seiridium unicorne TaxID=138068 RepID=A0ABR2UZK8_9PEZI
MKSDQIKRPTSSKEDGAGLTESMMLAVAEHPSLHGAPHTATEQLGACECCNSRRGDDGIKPMNVVELIQDLLHEVRQQRKEQVAIRELLAKQEPQWRTSDGQHIPGHVSENLGGRMKTHDFDQSTVQDYLRRYIPDDIDLPQVFPFFRELCQNAYLSSPKILDEAGIGSNESKTLPDVMVDSTPLVMTIVSKDQLEIILRQVEEKWPRTFQPVLASSCYIFRHQQQKPEALSLSHLANISFDGARGMVWPLACPEGGVLPWKSIAEVIYILNDSSPSKSGQISFMQWFFNRYCTQWDTSPMHPSVSYPRSRYRTERRQFQYHARHLQVLSQNKSQAPNRSTPHDGFVLHRQFADFPALDGNSLFSITESRTALAISLSQREGQKGAYMMVALADTPPEPRKSHHSLHSRAWKQLENSNIHAGLAMLQAWVYEYQDIWVHDWTELLVRVDRSFKLEIRDVLDHNSRKRLMFDDSHLRRSAYYFGVLQLLGIFTQWIQETIDDLALTISSHNEWMPEPYWVPLPGSSELLATEDEKVKENWRKLAERQRGMALPLLERIKKKTEEVTSLRDGLFSAQSVREATKSKEINQYLLVFTVATILYLPPTFVTTFYGMNLFDDGMEPSETKKGFWIFLAVVSLLTYILAFLGLTGIRRRHLITPYFGGWGKFLGGQAQPSGGRNNEDRHHVELPTLKMSHLTFRRSTAGRDQLPMNRDDVRP